MKKITTILLLLSFLAILSCTKKDNNAKNDSEISVLVFITGVIASSPAYEMMAQGALSFAEENPNVKIRVYEAGMNQALWELQLSEMVSDGAYDVVIGSNPSLPEVCINIANLFPQQKFIIFDAQYEGHPQIRTYLYNQYEQAFILGYLAGLITTSDMEFTNNYKRIGFIAAQEYPLLSNFIVPGFIEGAREVDPAIELDFRVVGNWVDAVKASELTSAMMNSGVDVFTSIAGGASQGLIRTAIEDGAYIVCFNSNSYNLAPGIIVGCGIMEQQKLTIEVLGDIVNGRVEYGKAQTIGVENGYLGFIFDDRGYYNYLPAQIREKFETFMQKYLLEIEN